MKKPAASSADLRRIREVTGEYVDNQTLSAQGTFVRSDGCPPVIDGPFAETEDLIAGWMIIDVETYDRALELAGEDADHRGYEFARQRLVHSSR